MHFEKERRFMFLVLVNSQHSRLLFSLGQNFSSKTLFSIFSIISLPKYLLLYFNHSLCSPSSREDSLYSIRTADPRGSLVEAFFNGFSPRLHPTPSISRYIYYEGPQSPWPFSLVVMTFPLHSAALLRLLGPQYLV